MPGLKLTHVICMGPMSHQDDMEVTFVNIVVSRENSSGWFWPTIHTKASGGEIRLINTLWPRQNGRNFADDIFKWIFLNENVWIPIKIWLKFVPQGPINNIPALVQIMAWRQPGDKPLSGPMMVRLPTQICVTRPQWVNTILQTED